MNPIEVGAIVTHRFYPDSLVGEVLKASPRFGFQVRWQSQASKMRHMCGEPRWHLANALVLPNEWESISKASEGLRCVEDESQDTERQVDVAEGESSPEVVDALEPAEVAGPIEESVNSEPLPTEDEEALEEQFAEEEP
jgi:hypothetical protein